MPRPSLNETQVWGRARRRQLQDDATGAKYYAGGFGKLPNEILHLISAMPPACLRAYNVAVLLANNKTGTFRISGEALAKYIGGGGKHQHRPAERALDRLEEAGLIQQEKRGRQHSSNEYRLLPLSRLDLERAGEVLSRPLTVKRSAPC